MQPRGVRHRRATWAQVSLMVAVLVLAFALLRLQVMSSEVYALMAKENRLRPLEIPAPRGTIYDRYGRVVAENVVGYRVSLMPAPVDSLRAALVRLQPVLGLTPQDLEVAMRRWQRAPHLPMEVLRDAPPDAVARLQERRRLFPGVLVHEYAKRHYPPGDAVAHLIGYVAEISEQELELPEFETYEQGRWIGKAGLERAYELQLGGRPGVRYLEVDAVGRIKRWMPPEMGLPPIPGKDLNLYLDLDLQRYIAQVWPKKFRGAFVALEPETGGVLAMYSYPSFDPNLFVGGIDPRVWEQLNRDPGKPLLDRAAASAQPPASTWKLMVAAMGLDLGVIRPEQYMPIACGGGLAYGGRYARCWGVHGAQNLIGGIKHSCDVYFYQVGIRIGFRRYLETGTRFGFGEKTGIDFPAEIASTFPESPEWWQRRFGYKPYDNEVLSLAIGQGPVTITPLKLAHLYVPIARPDGIAPAPRIAMNSPFPRDTIDYGLTRDQVWALEAGMRRVVGPGGTAFLSRLPDWDFMGKTGTAQNPHGNDHAWFVGIGGPKGGKPEIVAVMFLEFAEHGYTASGYVAEAVNFYLDRKHRRPFKRFASPRERLPRGLDVDWAWLNSPVEDPPRPRGN